MPRRLDLHRYGDPFLPAPGTAKPDPRPPVQMYAVAFYRNGETAPFHTWAPFGARGPESAEATIRSSIAQSAPIRGATLNQVDRYAFWDTTDPDHPTEGTVNR
jgi:hypothetical protein